MANFSIALEKVLDHEGNFSNDPVDSGEMTMSGISRNNWPDWDGWVIVDKFIKDHGIINNILIEAPRLYDKVCVFYQLNFWDKLKCNLIANQSVAESLFDYAVNTGIIHAVKIIQKCVGVPVDGIIGLITINAINAANSELLLYKMVNEKIKRYINICKKKPSQNKFLLGWITRSIII
jgi:lysozyme family protein